MTPRQQRTSVDVLVVGAGPAGLTAAAVAAEYGASVLVLDQNARAGGQIWRHRDPASMPGIARRLLQRVHDARVSIATGARVVDTPGTGEFIVDFRGRVARQHAGAVILATGAKERFLPFPGWTLPGAVGVGGLQALIKNGLRIAGARVAISGTGPLIFPVAAAAAEAGAELVLVAEQASIRALGSFGLRLIGKPDALVQAARYRMGFWRTRYYTSAWVTRAHGDSRLHSVTAMVNGRLRTIECDWLATGAGLTPNTELAQLLGCDLGPYGVAVDAQQATTTSGVWAAGECTGIKGDQAARIEGEIAARAAVGVPYAHGAPAMRRRDAGVRFGRALDRAFAPRAELRALADAATVLCRCEDVRVGDVDPAWTQRQAKLWTRIGMGECQGAVCGPACVALFGWGENVARPPLGGPPCGAWGDALAKDPGSVS